MRFLECLYPYQAHLCEIVDCGGDLYRVAVYHPAYGHHESAVLQDARSGPRGILLQHGSDRTAGHEHEEQRQNDKPDHSRTKTLWFSRLHGRSWMIALFPLRGSTSSRGGRSSLAPLHQRGKACLAPVGREVIFGCGIYTFGSLRPA